MKEVPSLIVMLTYNDKTVKNASEIFEQCKNSKATYWGFKEKPLPHEEMKKLFAEMKACGKTTVLEVVEYTEDEGLAGAKAAAEFGCDILMGTVYSDAINDFCKENGLRYMPFVGKVTERPSVLDGTAQEIIGQASELLKKGVYGFDLLGYRFTGDQSGLIERFVGEIKAPVCVAGSVDSLGKLDELKKTSPKFFTVGSAFFENKFGDDFASQIDTVCDYIKK